MKTHEELCERARRWLSGTRKCEPVFSGCASCDEIPDAIGWSSSWKFRGSHVVECKTSVSDFYADQRKYVMWRSVKWDHLLRRVSQQEIDKGDYVKEVASRMGDYRFYMCEPGVIAVQLVEKHAPDHGLLYVEGRRVSVVRSAPRREGPHYAAEVRFLRFAIINGKKPHEIAQSAGRVGLAFGESGHEQTDGG